jgi:hypothetical protein
MTIRKKIIWILEDDQALGAIIRETLEAGYALKMFHRFAERLEIPTKLIVESKIDSKNKSKN